MRVSAHKHLCEKDAHISLFFCFFCIKTQYFTDDNFIVIVCSEEKKMK